MDERTAQRAFVVTLGGNVWVNTTVAVIVGSEEEAAEKALQGARWDPSEWLSTPFFHEDPIVTSVDEETDRSELEIADQKHLLAGGDGPEG